MAMGVTRLIDQNVYYYVRSAMASSVWSGINVTTKIPLDSKDIDVPSVAIVREGVRGEPFELGSKAQTRRDPFVLHLYCTSRGMRDDLGEFVKNLFTNTDKDFLDYNDGFPPAGGQSVLGTLDFTFLHMNPVRVLGSPHPADKHRMDIRMSTELDYTIG